MKLKLDFEVDYSLDCELWLKQMEDNFKQLSKQDRKAKKNDSLIGRFVYEPVGDGKAFYVITKEYKKTVRIHVVTGIGDNYRVSYWGIEANIDKEYALKSISSRETLEILFKK